MADCPTRCPCLARSAELTQPDGRRIAYEEITTAFIPAWYEASMWRHYRGGRTHPIQVMNLNDNSVEKLPWSQQ
jgi:hypothetical protein